MKVTWINTLHANTVITKVMLGKTTNIITCTHKKVVVIIIQNTYVSTIFFTVTAENSFSFSINPYTTAQLRDSKHAFELRENNFINICLDVGMRGIGSHACGPALSKEYELPKKGKNVFFIAFKDKEIL